MPFLSSEDYTAGLGTGALCGQDNALALAGVQLPLEEEAHLVYQLTGILVFPNTIRKAIEGPGQVVVEEEQAAIEAAWGLVYPQLPPLPARAPDRGTVVRTWGETKKLLRRRPNGAIRRRTRKRLGERLGWKGIGKK